MHNMVFVGVTLVTEWESANGRNNREKINRARQAAEDLFKPTEQTAPAKLPTPEANAAAPGGQQGRRPPRVFSLPPRMPVGGQQAPARVEAKSARRKPAPQRAAVAVPSSQFGRIRALTNYGLTPTQVAELYGVSVAAVERILRASASPRRPR